MNNFNLFLEEQIKQIMKITDPNCIIVCLVKYVLNFMATATAKLM